MNREQGLRSLVLAGIFSIPFVALIVANFMFFPYITGKNFAFRVLVDFAFFGWLFLALKREEYRPRFGGIFAAAGTFLLVMLVADILSVNPEKSFWSNFERMEGWVTLLHLFAFFLVTSTVLSTEKLWTRFWNTSIGVSVAVALYGVGQLLGMFEIMQGGVRLDSTFGNATYLAIYMVFHMFLAAFFLLRSWERRGLRYMYLGIIFLEGFILYHTATRGAILGLLGGALLSALLIALFERENKMLRKVSFGIVGATVLIIALFFAVKDTSFVRESPVLSRFAQISLEEGTVSARFLIWNLALEGVKERPILGWGQESFNYVFNANYDPRLYGQEAWFDRTHNVFLDWLIAGGVLGLLAYLSLFAAALWYLWISQRAEPAYSVAEKAILTGLLGAYFFHNLFVFDNIGSYIPFFSLLAYIHFRGNRWKAPLLASKRFEEGALVRIGAPALIILALFSVYYFNAKGVLASNALLKALSRQENLNENLELFKQGIAYDSLGTQEIREQLSLAAASVLNANVDPSLKQSFITLAIDEMKRQIEERPGDTRTVLFLAEMYHSANRLDEAAATLEEAIKLSPRKQQLYFELGEVYLRKQDFAKAVQVLEHAFELERNYDEARIAFAAALVYAGRGGEARELLLERFKTDIIPDDRLIRAYFDAKQFDKVVLIWEKRVADNPNNPQYRVSLAAAYIEVGKRQSAIAELQKAIELNPAFKEQGEYYINEIRAGRNP